MKQLKNKFLILFGCFGYVVALTFFESLSPSFAIDEESLFFFPLILGNFDAIVGVNQLGDDILDVNGRGVMTYETFVNAVSYQQDGLFTYNGYQYAAWYRDNLHAVIVRRKLPDGNWNALEFDYTLPADDSHNTISMSVSPNDGRLHIIFGTHSPEIRYKQSVAGLATQPESHAWEAAKFGSTLNQIPGTVLPIVNYTYPRFELVNEELLLTWRGGGAGNGKMDLLNYLGDGSWGYLGAYTSNEGEFSANGGSSQIRNAYLNGFTADDNDRIHISWVWREGDSSVTCPGGNIANHGVGYAYSEDNGRSWQNNTGNLIGVTGTSDLIHIDDDHILDPISVDNGLINQETQAIDNEGRFHTIFSYVPQYILDTWDTPCVTDLVNERTEFAQPHHLWRDSSGTWHKYEIPFIQGAIGRSKLVFDTFDNAYLVMPDLRILAASKVSGWTDWQLVFDAANISIDGEIIVDRQRVKTDNILSIMYQEANDRVQPSALRLIEFQLSS